MITEKDLTVEQNMKNRMTEKEAIKRIQEHMVIHRLNEPHAVLITEALKMGVLALEKQIPKKPKAVEIDMDGMDMETGEEYTYKIDEAHCCNCNSVICDENDRFDEHYCNKCGQKIDWSEWE